MAAKNGLVSLEHVGGIPKIPDGYGESVKREEGTAAEGEDVDQGLH